MAYAYLVHFKALVINPKTAPSARVKSISTTWRVHCLDSFRVWLLHHARSSFGYIRRGFGEVSKHVGHSKPFSQSRSKKPEVNDVFYVRLSGQQSVLELKYHTDLPDGSRDWDFQRKVEWSNDWVHRNFRDFFHSDDWGCEFCGASELTNTYELAYCAPR